MSPGEIHSFSKHIARLSFRLQVGNICATFCKIKEFARICKKGVEAKGKTAIWKAESSDKPANTPRSNTKIHRTVLKWVSTIISRLNLLWFCSTTFCGWRATFSTNQRTTWSQLWLVRTRFPALDASYICALSSETRESSSSFVLDWSNYFGLGLRKPGADTRG